MMATHSNHELPAGPMSPTLSVLPLSQLLPLADSVPVPTSRPGFDPQAPIIIIGAGRSGSTLLMRLLQAHPDISFHGETGFLLPRIWQVVWEERFWHFWQHFVATEPHSSQAPRPQFSPTTLEQERTRVGQLLAHWFVQLLNVDPQKRAWGFKEIWNGSAAHRHEWSCYDAIFPQATWIHLIRHPLEFAGSTAAWNEEELTAGYLQARLDDWLAITHHSRQRQATSRFFEIRYEDLQSQPCECLTPILNAVGLDWSPACLSAVEQKLLQSRRQPQHELRLYQDLEKSAELLTTMQALNYAA